MRPEKLYLIDIIEAAGAIQRFCESVDEQSFLMMSSAKVQYFKN